MRKIISDEQGGSYSSHVVVQFQDTAGARDMTFECDPDNLYSIFHAMIGTLSGTNGTNQSLARIVRLGVRGLLIAQGEQILTAIYGKKEHPRPGKHDDLIAWYTDMFTKIGIAYLMKHDLLVRGTYNEEDVTYQISELASQPVPQYPPGDKTS